MANQIIHTYSVTIGEFIRCLKRISHASELSSVQISYILRSTCYFCFENLNIRLRTHSIEFQTNFGHPNEDRHPSIIEQRGFWVDFFSRYYGSIYANCHAKGRAVTAKKNC